MSGAVVAGDGGGRERKGKLAGKSPTDVVRAATAAGLDPSLGSAVLAVTGKTRLWKGERTEVARELCGHFFDGQESGEDAHVLIGSFGDPANAARLITRAKKRNRPWAWRAMKRSVQAAGVLLGLTVAWYGWNVARYYSGSPTIKINIQAELNAPSVATPVEQRGWPHYRDAQRLMVKSKFREAVGEFETWPYIKPGTPEWTKACALVDAAAPSVALIGRGSAMERSAYVIAQVDNSHVDFEKNPELGVPDGVAVDPRENPVSVGVLLPQLSIYRSHARLMSFVALRAAHEGRGADAVSAVETLLALSRHASEDGTLIAQLVSVAVAHLSFDVLNTIVRDHPDLFTDVQLTRLAHRVGAHVPSVERAGGSAGGAWRPSLGFERRAFDDILQRFFTDDGEGDGRLCKGLAAYNIEFGVIEPKAAGFVNPVIAGLVANRKETHDVYNRLMDRFEAESAKPLYERDPGAVSREVDEVLEDGSLRYSLVGVMVPAVNRATRSFDIGRTLRDATAAGLAVELYKRRNGRYPGAWSDLVPSMMPSAPLDLWSGRPLVMKAGAGAGGRPLIYSVGADKTDSGGTIGTPWDVVSAWSSATVPGYDGPIATGDWVIWPKVEAVGERPQVGPAVPPGTPPPIVAPKKPAYRWGWLGGMNGI